MEETLGKRIAAHRRRLGITQDRLAEQLGVTAQAVSKWENDQSCPDITMLPRLAAVFGTTTDALLGIAREAEPAPAGEEAEPEGLHIQKGGWDFRWEAGFRGKLGFALWVLLSGLLLLLKPESGLWNILWPTGLLVFGVLGLFRRFGMFSLACGLLGGYFLLSNLGLLPFNLGRELLLPVFLVLFGLGLLTDAFRGPRHSRYVFRRKDPEGTRSSFTAEGEGFNADLSFGEETYRVELSRLQHGRAEVSFGDLTVDLTGCEEFDPAGWVKAECSFGQLTLLVPRRCRVVTEKHSSAFGSIDISGHPAPDAAETLRLEAEASFGSIAVRYV